MSMHLHMRLHPRPPPSLVYHHLHLRISPSTTPFSPFPRPINHPQTRTRILTSTTPRTLHTTPPNRHPSPLFALGALSNSREGQWFKKASGLSAVEHSTSLELIKNSEVLPFQRGQKVSGGVVRRGKSRRGVEGGALAAFKPAVAEVGGVKSSVAVAAVKKPSFRDTKALAVGKEVLARNAEKVARLQGSLRRLRDVSAKEKEGLVMENRRLSRENKGASVGVVVAVGVATAVVAWKTWPEARRPRAALSRGNGGEKGDTIREDGAVSDPVFGGLETVEVPHVLPVVEPEMDPVSASAIHVESATPRVMVPNTGAARGDWRSWFWNS